MTGALVVICVALAAAFVALAAAFILLEVQHAKERAALTSKLMNAVIATDYRTFAQLERTVNPTHPAKDRIVAAAPDTPIGFGGN